MLQIGQSSIRTVFFPISRCQAFQALFVSDPEKQFSPRKKILLYQRKKHFLQRVAEQGKKLPGECRNQDIVVLPFFHAKTEPLHSRSNPRSINLFHILLCKKQHLGVALQSSPCRKEINPVNEIALIVFQCHPSCLSRVTFDSIS